MKALLCICVLFAVAHGLSFNGDKVLRITINEVEQLEKLQNLVEDYELDFWSVPRYLGDSADIRVPFKHLSQFLVHVRTNRLAFQVFIEDVQKLIDEENSPRPAPRDLASFDYDVYHTFDEIQNWIEDFVAEYPSIASKDVVGTSYEGREFAALTLSAGVDRPQFVLNCGIHAREWITPATCLYAAKFIAEGYYGDDSTIKSLLNEVDFVFIPSSNPDGYAHTQEDRMWRKTRTPNPSTPTCIGKDPNRNWDADFCGVGSSNNTCSATYCGTEPFSEPCTLAQKNFVENLPNVKMYMDVHAYGQLWMFSYGYTADLADHFSYLDVIAKDSVVAIKARHGTDYEPGPIATTIYVASGITTDYFYDKANIKCSFTAELRDTGRYGFLLPADQIKPTAEEAFEGFKVMAQAIIDGKC